ncbi:MAG: oxidoreductase [Treponema sp. GWB1_62_6]|nr:MAG: oxidoreductase [Treponema sp. GWA1_62_8]OHE67838.1 MAG: oxidoreductase [Treponema sp. GWC1_61_84]OHE71934.1 MAG: oxidoreductase [Treponema sp. GWB1_62_6]HCM27312.1 oxidoreductase [Treponema sp.]
MASENPVKVGFVGSGFAARFHYESLMRLPGSGVRVVGVFSPHEDRRLAFAKERGLTPFATLDALLEEVDVVHVVAPASVHEQATVRALGRGVVPIVEKPFTGYFGPPGDAPFRGNDFPKQEMLEGAIASAGRMLEAEKKSGIRIRYAENWIFTPSIQKELEIIRKTKAQILWMIGEESHSGSHSPHYGIWKSAGGGALMGKGTHPLTTVLYLKRADGLARLGRPIRPKTVSARVHELTRLPGYEDRGFLRTDYTDVEDWGLMHLTFDDGTIADVYSSEIVMGGVHNWLEVFANNHRTRCNINPVDGLETYNPKESQFADVYVVEKIGTKQGWSKPAMNEDWMNGYFQEMEYFYANIAGGEAPLASGELGFDGVATLYSAYLSAERRGAEVGIPL